MSDECVWPRPDSEVVPIDAFFDEGTGPNRSADFDPAQVVGGADVILAHDWMSQDEVLVYGRDLLQSIIDTDESSGAEILRIGIDAESNELEKLIALVKTIKGKHDYPE